jgi:aspartyl-tRNA(Asn)/glutamyl-tRNA(Gln) amidotransferase subunit C
MPALSRKEVEEIALLARLHLDSSELDHLEQELGAILEHFGALASVDTTDVPAMTHAVPLDLRLRSDEVAPSLPVADAVKNAPNKKGDVFVVPAIIDPRESK